MPSLSCVQEVVVGLFANLFLGGDGPPFDQVKSVRKLLSGLPQCPAKLRLVGVHGSNGSAQCDAIVHVRTALTWLVQHALVVSRVGSQEEAARAALQIWLERANTRDESIMDVPALFQEILAYRLDSLVRERMAELFCTRCGCIVRDPISAKPSGPPRGDFTSVIAWQCHAGHLLYEKEYQMFISFSNRRPLDREV